MAKRQSAAEALKAKEEAFLQGEAPKSKQAVKARKPAKPAKKETRAITVRIDADLAERLWRACAFRRADRKPPYSQQAVVAAAIEAWLKKNE